MWRVWIEIGFSHTGSPCKPMSPSVWRVWIEIPAATESWIGKLASPSVWRVWIEMHRKIVVCIIYYVTLRVEGVD